MQIEQIGNKASVAAIERAIEHMQYNLRHPSTHCLSLSGIETDLLTLEMLKVAYLLAERNAAKEQRKGRANTQDAVAQLENDFNGFMNHIYNHPR